MALQDELSWFESNRAFIASTYQGQWVLIKDKKIQGAFATDQAALAAGLRMFQKDFLIKQALPQEPVHTVPAAKL